ncbi:uncharacterized protein ACN427_005164 isoform 2-T13 [Glossina fuscipes fuscipes]
MNWRHCIYRLLALMQIVQLSENSHVQLAKQQIQTEIKSSIGQLPAVTHPSDNFNAKRHHNERHHHHHHHNHHHHHHQKQHYHQSYHENQRQQKQKQKQRQRFHWHHGQRVHHFYDRRNRWLLRRQRRQQQFTSWSVWSECGMDCVQRRERYCKIKRKCGHTKHIEERKCRQCQRLFGNSTKIAANSTQHYTNTTPAINANVAVTLAPLLLPKANEMLSTVSTGTRPIRMQRENDRLLMTVRQRDINDSVFYIVKATNEKKKRITQFFRESNEKKNLKKSQNLNINTSLEFTADDKLIDDYHDRDNDDKNYIEEQINRRNLEITEATIDSDAYQYEDFDIDSNRSESQYSDISYEDSNDYNDGVDHANASSSLFMLPTAKEKATPENLIPRYRRIYSKWSRWTKCSPKCTTRRYKKCRLREQCGREVLREIAYCYTERSFCQQWLQAQLQKSPAYELRPMGSRRRDTSLESGTLSNSVVSDFIMNGKGYRGPEYAPMKLKCGTAPIRNNKRNMYNMLKIIGGKTARKGEWPWQVAIFNRYKEAFCGGTLIAPQWILTAAHCVRKVLYVRLGEHNLDYEDGTELQLKVLRSYKHPNFDKKTVDSDVALLRLPRPVNTTMWIGYSCLPRPYQPLPKNIDCTVIGWGKRRNRDVAGTSVLHQAEVPIIPMDNCRSVYHDYTITKNMFCAGHKRGRIDTCAGDSGGPLLCRDTTRPNHPWTIFGITSFGDGCAKRNKFGIYAKVPNYVDWVWSVINCNGNCKMHQRLG